MNQEFQNWVAKWGIDLDPHTGCVGPGWVPILERLTQDLVELGWDRQLLFVREKFGTVRFAVVNNREEFAEVLAKAQRASATTCEICGKPGWIHTTNKWLRARCDAHRDSW